MPDFNLDEFLPYRFSVLAGQTSREFERRYRDRFGLRVAEWRIVAHLSQTGPVSMREIERRVDLHKSRVSRAAARLETAGYISKRVDSADRRMVELELTAEGESMMTELEPLALGYQRELLLKLDGGEDALRRALDALMEMPK